MDREGRLGFPVVIGEVSSPSWAVEFVVSREGAPGYRSDSTKGID